MIAPPLCARAAAASTLHDFGLTVISVHENGKRPVGADWPNKYRRRTRDTLIKGCEQNPNRNLGVLLGPAGGIIDIEFDGPDGPEQLRQLGIDLPETMTAHTSKADYRVHHIYVWDDRLAGLASTAKHGDIEFRFGSADASQSVVWGTVDGHRRWFEDRPIARLSNDAIAKILAIVPSKSAPVSTSSDDLFADLHASLQQQRIGETWVWCAKVGLRIVSQTSKDGSTYLHLDRCPSKPPGHTDGDPAIRVSVEGVVYWACLHAKCQGKTIDDVRALFATPEPQPAPKPEKPKSKSRIIFDPIDALTLLSQPDPELVTVIDGLISLGDVSSVVAQSKRRKSWYVMQLALSVASGKDFLGMKTTKGKVVIYDAELRRDAIRRRLRQVAKAMGVSPDALKRIEIIPLKGTGANLYDLRENLLDRQSKPELVIIDPLYKFLGEVDENSNGQMTVQYALLDAIAEKVGCAVIVVHHSSKGRQTGKANTDIGSGAGAQSRSVDVHSTIIEHADAPGIYILSADVRNFAPFTPICIQHEHPLWQLAPDFTPAGKKPPSLVEFVSVFATEPANKKEALILARQQLGITVDACKAYLETAIADGLLELPDRIKMTDPQTIRRKVKT